MDEIDLNERGKFEKRITDALRQTIAVHGPITKEWIGSASKRIIATIKDHNKVIRENEMRVRSYESLP